MIASALQTPYTEEDYKLYLEWTQGRDVRKIAFSNALYRYKTGGHIQCVVSGEYNHGKSTTAMLLTKWDTIYTRELFRHFNDPRLEKVEKHLKFSIKNSVIISPKDPASKFIQHPQFYRPYEVDEGYLWATSQEAGEKKTSQLRDGIAQNRKLAPSQYWVYPNIFKMPSILLENMMEIVHKTSVGTGIMVAPSTVIQIKEKFDKKKIERYATKPRYFINSMKFHSGFIFYPNFPRMRGKAWEKYLLKYEKYKIINKEASPQKDTKKHSFFQKLDALIEKGTININAKADIAKYIRIALQNGGASQYSMKTFPDVLASEYSDWKMEKVGASLLDSLEHSNFKLDFKSEEQEEEE